MGSALQSGGAAVAGAGAAVWRGHLLRLLCLPLRLCGFLRFMLPGLLLCVLPGWLLLAAPSNAMPQVTLPQDLPQPHLFGKAEFLEDSSNALTLEAVRRLPSTRFTVLQKSNFARGFSGSSFWLRFRVVNTSAQPLDWVLQHRLPFTDYVETWILVDGQLQSHALAGDRTRLDQRQLATRVPGFSYRSVPGETAEVLVRLRNIHAADVQLLFRLDPLTGYVASLERDEGLLGILYGVPLALIFSALTGALVSRDRRFLLYVLYALATLLSWIGFNGHFQRFFHLDAPDFWNNALHVVLLLQSIASSVFVRDFLQTRTRLPRFDLFFRAMILAAVLAIGLRLCGVFTLVTQLTLLLMALSASTALAAWLAVRQGLVYARWYLLAQLFSTVPVAIGIIGARLGVYPYDGFMNYQYVYFAELLLLAVAQHDRVRILQDRQSRLEREHEQALAERNRFLEAEVVERTQRLEALRRRAVFVTEVQDVTRRVAGGEFAARLPMPEEADMQQLATSVNTMSASLARLDGARRRWLAEISHELRTPLAVLIAEIEALIDGVREPDQARLESLHRTTLRLARLVSDLHELAMSYVRPLSCKFASVDIAALLLDLMPHFNTQAQQRGLELSLHIDSDLRHGHWDAGRLNQLLINLIDNSMHYTDAPGRIDIRITAAGPALQIEVTDSAPGLSDHDLAHLFEPLYRADAARSRRTGGSGLGLKIAKAIVEAHHGTLTVQPSALHGVQVVVQLPFAQEPT